MKKAIALLALAFAWALVPAGASADPILDAGWDAQTLGTLPGDPTDESPFGFILAGPAYLRVADCCVPGDVWTITDLLGGGGILLVTADGFPTVHPGAFGDGEFAAFFDLGWTTPGFTRGEILLGPGEYGLSLSGDGAGGIPAGVGVRLDSAPIPEPGSLALLGLGLSILALSRRRR